MDVRVLRLLGACVLVLALVSPAAAQRPWQSMQLFKKIDVDPNNSFELTDRQGPWMIMCVTFRGEQAETQARELVHELRSVYKLPAYTHCKTFDYTQGTVGRGIDRYGQPKKMRYRVDKVDEVAVLIGDYMAVDDPPAKKTLDKIKSMQPDCLNTEKLIKDGKQSARPLAAFRHLVQEALPADHANKQKGPMFHAFITGNPAIPREYFVPKGIDKLVYEMNQPLPNSLLHCHGRYTVKVATFTGKIVIDPAAIKEIESGKKAGPGGLAEAAERAHRMCQALRTKGYEAYEFHDRHASIVTVGSFDSVGTPRADGKTEIDPQLHKLIETFSAPLIEAGGKGPARGEARQIVDLPFDSQALPVEVPQSNLIVDYNRHATVQR